MPWCSDHHRIRDSWIICKSICVLGIHEIFRYVHRMYENIRYVLLYIYVNLTVRFGICDYYFHCQNFGTRKCSHYNLWVSRNILCSALNIIFKYRIFQVVINTKKRSSCLYCNLRVDQTRIVMSRNLESRNEMIVLNSIQVNFNNITCHKTNVLYVEFH